MGRIIRLEHTICIGSQYALFYLKAVVLARIFYFRKLYIDLLWQSNQSSNQYQQLKLMVLRLYRKQVSISSRPNVPSSSLKVGDNLDKLSSILGYSRQCIDLRPVPRFYSIFPCITKCKNWILPVTKNVTKINCIPVFDDLQQFSFPAHAPQNFRISHISNASNLN